MLCFVIVLYLVMFDALSFLRKSGCSIMTHIFYHN